MKNAIIFGATGYIGIALTKELLRNQINVLAIGRKNKKELIGILPLDNIRLQYIQITKSLESFFSELLANDYIDREENVFYHLAWSGIDRLTDGNIKEQIHNLIVSTQALSFASSFGCSKFINVSSQEEAIFRDFIISNKWKTQTYASSPVYYAGAKLANSELLSLVSYLNKIDYINTRFSIALDSQLSGVSFVASTLKKIMANEVIPNIKNTQPCEIIMLDELVRAYYQIGIYGKNKADYYLGKGKPNTLMNYFTQFRNTLHTRKMSKIATINVDESLLEAFNPINLNKDIGFAFTQDLENLCEELCL